MPYIGNSPANIGNYQIVDDISSGFDNVTTTFALTAASQTINPAKSGQLLVSINGVLQEPDDTGTEGFLVSGSNIVFSSAPTTGSTFWCVFQGQNVDIGTPSNATVGTAQLSATGTASATTFLRGDNTWVTPTDTVYSHPTNHAISVVTGLQSALDGKVDDSQVLTNVPSGAVFTDTETTTTLSVAANVLTYTDEDGLATNIDLSLYLDDTNAAYIASGSLNGTTGVATFTRSDATSFDVNMSAFLDDTTVTVNNTLTSTSTTEALSANQGRLLKLKTHTQSSQNTSGTVTLNLDASNNHNITLSGNATLALSNIANNVGVSGNIILQQDATGGRSIVLASEMKTPLGGASIDFVTGANSISALSYYVVSSSIVLVNYIGNFA